MARIRKGPLPPAWRLDKSLLGWVNTFVPDKAGKVSDAVASTVSVASADASDLATCITLANETKADLNTLASDLNAALTQVNLLLANMRDARSLET